MKHKYDWLHHQALVTIVAFGAAIGWNPASAICSAASLLILLTYRIADRYFHDSFHDENKQSIAQLRADFAKIKGKQDTIDLKAAFGGKSG